MAWTHGDLPVAIDPATCGCTECIIGEYAPEGSSKADEAFAAFADGRVSRLRSNTGSSYIVWRGESGKLHVETFAYNPRDYVIAELPQWDTPVLVWKDSYDDPQIKVVEDCYDASSVRFVID